VARAGSRKSTFERLFELFLAHAGAAFDVSILSLGVKLSSGGFDLPVFMRSPAEVVVAWLPVTPGSYHL
jgi:hypothetical protein